MAKMHGFINISHKLVRKYVKASPPPTEHKTQRPHRSVWVWTRLTRVRARPVSLQATPCGQGEGCSLNIPHSYSHPDKRQSKSAGISTEEELFVFCYYLR